MRIEKNYSLKAHNTFGIEARCKEFIEFSNIDEAIEAAAMLRAAKEPYILIGGGSNLLLTRDYDGIVVHSAIKGILFEKIGKSVVMTCGSGEVFDDVVAASIEEGCYGLENLSLIPGEVGASAVQNIGAYGVEAKDYIDKVLAVDIMTGELRSFSNESCCYGYRQSRFKQDWKNRYLITHVTYALQKTFTPRTDYGNIRSEMERRGIVQPTARQLRELIVDIRNAKLPDPKVTGNAGSFFMNPVVTRRKYEELAERYPEMPHYEVDEEHEKIPAGWMIEQCGWKGQALGPAGVHDRQALVLVNRGGATGQDIVRLCQAIQHDVKERFGIDLVPEVNIV